MKNKRLVTVFLFGCIYCSAAAQDFSQVRSYLFTHDDFVRTHDNYIVTSQALNKFFANKLAYYLSSSNDLSLFKNYAILTPSSNNLYIGHNFIKEDKDNYKVRPFFTMGLNANYANSLAPVFSGDKFQGGLSLNLKYTIFFKGSVKFGNKEYSFKQEQTAGLSMGQKDSMNISRSYILGTIMKTMIDDSTNLVKGLDLSTHLSVTDKARLIKSKFSELSKGYKESFAKQQADVLDKSALTNSSHFSWLSFSVDIPFTPTYYTVAAQYTSPMESKSSYPYAFNLLYSNVWENAWGKFFLLTKAGIQKNNSVLSKQLSKKSYQEYRSLGGTDTVKSVQLSSKDIYVGKYDAFVDPSAKLQLIYFPKFSNAVGIDMQLEKNVGSYHPLNALVGIPFRLASTNTEKPVTFEVQLQMPDLANQVTAGKKFWDKAIVGVTVGLPFGSTIY